MRIVRTFACSLVALACGCDDTHADAPDLEQRWVLADELSRGWCRETQRTLANLDEDAPIDEDVAEGIYDLVHTRTSLRPDANLPIQIVTYFDPIDRDGETIVGEARCKMRSADGIALELGLGEPAADFSCRVRNAAALDWADAHLSEDERERYAAEGIELSLGDDVVAGSGSEWNEVGSSWTLGETRVTVSAATLQTMYDPADPDAAGVHYCKLVTPSLALDWMTRRAFWDDPVAGPTPETDVRESQGTCEPQAETLGSCLFEFQYTRQHFCQEYSGSGWSAESAQSECAQRSLPEFEAVYSSKPCAERGAETEGIDGDGTYYGQCVILCGHELETRWHQYSLFMDTPAEETCRGVFYDPDGMMSDS